LSGGLQLLYRPAGYAFTGAQDQVIVLHGGKRIVEVVEQAAPFLVIGGAAEAGGVVFQALPADQQQVLMRRLQAALQLVAAVAGQACDDLRRGAEGRLEAGGQLRLQVQNGYFEDYVIPLLPPV
jgi:hypothetical protein